MVVEGSVLVGGRPPDATFRHRVSFVQQEDTLMGVLSVREAFHFAARLSGVSGLQAQEMLVGDTLALLGLDGCADQRIGDMFFHGISSGERRRASIGIELMKQPCTPCAVAVVCSCGCVWQWRCSWCCIVVLAAASHRARPCACLSCHNFGW